MHTRGGWGGARRAEGGWELAVRAAAALAVEPGVAGPRARLPEPSRRQPAEALAYLERGPEGLGLAVNPQNVVAEVAPGGQAEADGLLELGDEVLMVDGVQLEGRPMAKVMTTTPSLSWGVESCLRSQEMA